ncbi:hypothetical protein ACKWTF_014045 [Chironomus riparius]
MNLINQTTKMNLKLTLVLQTMILLKLTFGLSATTINCSFDNIDIPLSHLITIQGYGCDIQSLTLEDSQNSVKFSGIHNNNKTDDDVKIIKYQIYAENQLPQVDSSFCEKFSNIETIYISQLEILSIDEHSLQNCQKLSKLYFYENKIQAVPANLLIKSSKLTVLNLDFNYLTELPDNFLKNQKRLEDLNLTNNQFSSFSSNFFDSLTNLHSLGLGSNKISAIDSKWFEKLENLVFLGLERNEITEIPNNIFSKTQYLVELNLSNNKINTLTTDSFNGLKGLKSINLDHNEIEELPKNLFKDNKNLEELSIGHNKLTIVDSTSFGHPINLTTLHCYFNMIEGFDESLIDNTALFDLDMTENFCVDGWMLSRNRMKTNLKQCFENFRVLVHESSDVMTPTTTDPAHTTSTYKSMTTTTANVEEPDNSFDIRGNIENSEILNGPKCGKRKTGLQTTIRGNAISKGDYPWNVAIMEIKISNKSSQNEIKYICGGTVVSKTTVVTAAHCFIGKHQSHQLRAANILVYIGVHNLSHIGEIGRLTIAIRKIIIHPGWNPNSGSFHADIAILELDEILTFTNYIQPICLMHPGSDMERITEGIVAGFGKSEFNDVESVARVINMPIVSYNECKASPDHKSLLSDQMFCAGHANGTGVCVGDSGSGLHVVYKNTYYLRGIVSASLKGELYGCNVNAYAVFTDAMKHIAFIETGKFDGRTSQQIAMDKLFEVGYTLKDFDNPEIIKKLAKIKKS